MMLTQMQAASNKRLDLEMHSSMRPVRSEGIEIQSWGSEHVVFDSLRDRLFRTSPTATLILLLCTGRNTVGEIADLVKEAHQLPQAPTAMVSGAVTQMMREGMLATLSAAHSATQLNTGKHS